MRISELIASLEEIKSQIGDVDLYRKENDGRSTDAIPVGYFGGVKVTYGEIWKGHSAGKKNFLTL